MSNTTTKVPAMPQGKRYRKNPVLDDLRDENYARAWLLRRLAEGDDMPVTLLRDYVKLFNQALKKATRPGDREGILMALRVIGTITPADLPTGPKRIITRDLKEGMKFSFPVYRPNITFTLLSMEFTEDGQYAYLTYAYKNGKKENGMLRTVDTIILR